MTRKTPPAPPSITLHCLSGLSPSLYPTYSYFSHHACHTMPHFLLIAHKLWGTIFLISFSTALLYLPSWCVLKQHMALFTTTYSRTYRGHALLPKLPSLCHLLFLPLLHYRAFCHLHLGSGSALTLTCCCLPRGNSRLHTPAHLFSLLDGHSMVFLLPTWTYRSRPQEGSLHASIWEERWEGPFHTLIPVPACRDHSAELTFAKHHCACGTGHCSLPATGQHSCLCQNLPPAT